MPPETLASTIAAADSAKPVRVAMFRAMGTDVRVLGPASTPARRFDPIAARVRDLFDRLERRFSRFRDDSELSEVNRHAGRWITVSDEFAELLDAALDGAWRSEGLFDPTMLGPLVAAGYDRDFRAIESDAEVSAAHRVRDRVRGRVHAPGPAGRWQDVRLQGNHLLLPDGVALDFGGIGKGWAADLASELMGGLRWAIVDAGGDLRIRGTAPDGGLDVAVEDPEAFGAQVVHLSLESGALATSSITMRAWSRGGRRYHHIIDPRTGRPALTRVLQATAWGATCAEAEIRATWALLAGPSILDRLPAILFLDDGRVLVNLEPAQPQQPRTDATSA